MAGEDPKYVAAVKRLLCSMCGKPGPNEAHHHRHAGAGRGQKAHDHLSMAMCLRCHHDLHALSGVFKGFTRAMITEWQDKRVGLTWRLIKGTWDGCPLPAKPDYSNTLEPGMYTAAVLRRRLEAARDRLKTRDDDDEAF